MKIRILLFTVLMLALSSAFAQKGEPVILRVIYQFKHVNDISKPKKAKDVEMILRLGKTESRYNNWTEELKSAYARKNGPTASTGAASGAGGFGFAPTVFVESIGLEEFDLMQYPNLNKLKSVMKLSSSNYLIETTLPIINWKVYEEKKEIGGYTCQKAVGAYAGRTYTAWFAPELPFRNGPWKLWGLPGLILEATDATGEVRFLFKEMNKSEEQESTAARNTRVVKVSEKAFEQASQAFDKDPVAFYQTQLPIGTTEKAQLAFRDDDGNFHYGEDAKKFYDAYKKNLKQRKNNPLELKKP
ncbi:MAG: GLPGLI family protein [Pedobacter sp.]|nr:MAG: GLPGLI family protein [Pedobacter sp.]